MAKGDIEISTVSSDRESYCFQNLAPGIMKRMASKERGRRVRIVVSLMALLGAMLPLTGGDSVHAAAFPPHGVETDVLVRDAGFNSCAVKLTHGNLYGHVFAKVRRSDNFATWLTTNPAFPDAGSKFAWQIFYPYFFGGTTMCRTTQVGVTMSNGSFIESFYTAYSMPTSSGFIEANSYHWDYPCCWLIVGSTVTVDGNDENAVATRNFPGV